MQYIELGAMKHEYSSDKACPRVRHVSCPKQPTRVVSDTNTTPTHNYTELCDFLKKLVVSMCRCPCHVRCQYPCFI